MLLYLWKLGWWIHEIVISLCKTQFLWITICHILLEHLQRCEVCDPAKKNFTSKFSYLLLSNPTHKIKMGTASGRQLIANHLHQSIWLANQKQGAAVRSYYILLWLVLGFAVPFTSLSKLCKSVGPKPLCWAKLECFDFSSPNFNLQGHTNHWCQSMHKFECQLWSFPNPRLQWVTSKLSQQTFSLQQPISVRTCFPSPRKNSTTSSLTILWRRRDRSIKQHHVLQNIATDMRILNQVASKAIRLCDRSHETFEEP